VSLKVYDLREQLLRPPLAKSVAIASLDRLED